MDTTAIDAALKTYLTPLQAAQRLGIGKRATIYAAERGQFAGAIFVAGRWFIPPKAVSARLRKHGTGQIPQAKRAKRKPEKDLRQG